MDNWQDDSPSNSRMKTPTSRDQKIFQWQTSSSNSLLLIFHSTHHFFQFFDANCLFWWSYQISFSIQSTLPLVLESPFRSPPLPYSVIYIYMMFPELSFHLLKYSLHPKYNFLFFFDWFHVFCPLSLIDAYTNTPPSSFQLPWSIRPKMFAPLHFFESNF